MIKIVNAYENNLKNISLNIPKNRVISIIGVSGSGKSTLIYNVIAEYAKRKEKIDSGNATCLDFAIKPKVDKIENLPYVIKLAQRGIIGNINSTIATFTGLYELLRFEFVKNGQIISENNDIIETPSIKMIKDYIKKFHSNAEIFAIIAYKKYTNGDKELKILKGFNIKEAVFINSYNNKEILKKVKSVKNLNPKYYHTILVPIKLDEIEKYQDLAIDGFMLKTDNKIINFDIEYPDLKTGKLYQKKSIELLSFNSTSKHSGKCQKCDAKGIIEDIDWKNLINKNSINQGFLNLELNNNNCYKYIGLCIDKFEKILKKSKINSNITFFDLSESIQEEFKNIIKEKLIKHKNRPSISKFITTKICDECKGSRLNYKANAVKLFGKSISELTNMSVNELYNFLKDKTLSHKKILDILKALQKATLGYLSLNRTTDTLSGGELQRLKFAVELIGEFKSLLYILDEPSTGLHPYNNFQMIELIKELRDKGNTILISEHNQEYIKNSDFIVELGIGSGEEGGDIIFYGKSKKFNNFEIKREKRKVDLSNSLELIKVNINNINNENFTIPLNCLVVISGISGSGKSSLIHKALIPAIKSYKSTKTYKNIEKIKGIEKIIDVVELTQAQIGNNPRSIVATYLNLFDEIRDFFAKSEESIELGFNKSYFSFNSNIGACEECKGAGYLDNEIICPSCLGDRYKPEVLEIKVNGCNISEILNLTIDKLEKIFNSKKLLFAFDVLKKLRLSHLTLGRITPTLSGGEAGRLKLAKVLIESFEKIKKGGFLFVLDEPTTGLNNLDIQKLFSIFDEIINYGNSLIVIEHNLDIIKNSDFIIDIGPESGIKGGKNIFSGVFEDLLTNKDSLTAKAFKKEFQSPEKIKIESKLKEKKFNFDKSKYPCDKEYLDDKHFLIKKEKAKNYKVIVDNKTHKYFKTKKELFEFANNLKIDEIFFNPYTIELFKYKIVPLSIKKDRIKRLKKLKFKLNLKDYEIDEWQFRVKLDNLEKAYNFGKGWISVESNGERFELFTRPISIKQKIIGNAKITEYTFNKYVNSCIYCKGESYLYGYDKDLLIKDKTKSIVENGFLFDEIKLDLRNIKSVIKKFKEERVFDFTKSFNELNEEEKNIFLFGFKEYKFLKKGGRINALSDYIEWKGLYIYVYENLDRIKYKSEIINSKHICKCPFCVNGIQQEIKIIK